jgi:DNA-directed RNA polymerase subunit N (RpoN/RPB10)
MIIPVRCMTCGKVLADKWEEYDRRCKAVADDEAGGKKIIVQADGSKGKTPRGKILDELEITNLCCRTIMLSHVDLSLVI